MPVGEDDNRGVSGEQPAPEEQRTFLSAPPGGELIQQGHAAVTMLGNIGEAEVAGDEAEDQNAGSNGNQRPHGVNRAFAANNQKRLALDAADHRCE
jgi:hypothetical protein